MMRPIACQINTGRIQVLSASGSSSRTSGRSFSTQANSGVSTAVNAAHPSWKVWLSGVAMMAAFGVTVLAAGFSVNVSYDLAQVQQRHQAALQQEKILQQELAQAQSLETVRAFAQDQGFSTSTEYQATLTVQNPVAQR